MGCSNSKEILKINEDLTAQNRELRQECEMRYTVFKDIENKLEENERIHRNHIHYFLKDINDKIINNENNDDDELFFDVLNELLKEAKYKLENRKTKSYSSYEEIHVFDDVIEKTKEKLKNNKNTFCNSAINMKEYIETTFVTINSFNRMSKYSKSKSFMIILKEYIEKDLDDSLIIECDFHQENDNDLLKRLRLCIFLKDKEKIERQCAEDTAYLAYRRP